MRCCATHRATWPSIASSRAWAAVRCSSSAAGPAACCSRSRSSGCPAAASISRPACSRACARGRRRRRCAWCRPRCSASNLANERFGLIFSAFRAFQHLYTVEDQLACLARARAHLAPGGRFAFDVFAPRLARMALLEEPEAVDLRFEHDGEQVARHAAVTRDPVAQILNVRFRYERSRDGVVVGNEHAHFRMRWFWRYELEHLLARAGFASEIFGD
jgi:hypothetical protein